MRPIIEWTLRFLDDPLDVIQRASRPIDVVFRDEDHPRLRECCELRSFCQRARVHHAAVVARPARSCAFVCPLDFAVVEFSLAVLCQHIETYAASVEIVRTLLCNDAPNNEIVSIKEDAQQELHPLGIVIKAYIEKCIVDQAEFLNQYTVLRRNVLLDDAHGRAILLTLFYYHSMRGDSGCQGQKELSNAESAE